MLILDCESFAILRWGELGVLLENFREITAWVEAALLANLGDGNVAAAQHFFSLRNANLPDEARRVYSCHALYLAVELTLAKVHLAGNESGAHVGVVNALGDDIFHFVDESVVLSSYCCFANYIFSCYWTYIKQCFNRRNKPTYRSWCCSWNI